MTIHFNIATTWNQLNSYQRSRISDLIFNSEQGSKGVYFAVLFYLFCPTKWTVFRAWKERYHFLRLILQVPISKLVQYIDFIFADLNLTKFPKYVKVDGKKYYGPADRLSNVTIEELNFAYKHYFDWITTKDENALNRLVTTIYRPERKKKRGDIRELFDEQNIMRRGSVFIDLDLATKISIGFAFKGSVEYMFGKYPVIFPKRNQPANGRKQKKQKYRSLVPMINSMFMGEDQPLGNRESVLKTNAYVFFDISQETVIAYKKREQELKRRK